MLSAGLGTQVVGSILRPASYCGAYGYKPSLGGINRGGSHDYMSQSVQGVIAASLADCWQVAIEIVQRTVGDPGHAGIIGPPLPPDADMPTTMAFLQTPGWEIAVPEARAALETALARLSEAGVVIISADDDADVARIEKLLPESLALTRRINAWESRWPLNTYVDKDKNKLSEGMVERLHEAEAMTVDEYRHDILRREEIRAAYASLSNKVESCITLSAPDVAPVGLASTGNPIFAVQGSLLGVPTLSLPLITLRGLPVGIQLLGFLDEDAGLFAHAAAIEPAIGPIEIA
jgi:Asp-tRNA(Asn)/Glu-tRNA(Gln) amidotransferase A subunit family amidase